MLWKGNASLIGCKGTKKNAHAQAKRAFFFEKCERTGVSPAFRERTFEVDFAMFE